jgi:uncharacterized SAM-dependent methyltransferase
LSPANESIPRIRTNIRRRDSATLLAEAGFADIQMWTDPRGWFGVFFARQGNTRT